MVAAAVADHDRRVLVDADVVPRSGGDGGATDAQFRAVVFVEGKSPDGNVRHVAVEVAAQKTGEGRLYAGLHEELDRLLVEERQQDVTGILHDALLERERGEIRGAQGVARSVLDAFAGVERHESRDSAAIADGGGRAVRESEGGSVGGKRVVERRPRNGAAGRHEVVATQELADGQRAHGDAHIVDRAVEGVEHAVVAVGSADADGLVRRRADARVVRAADLLIVAKERNRPAAPIDDEGRVVPLLVVGADGVHDRYGRSCIAGDGRGG